MKNLAGKSFTIESGIDNSVTFFHDQRLYYLYSEIPQESIFHYNLRRTYEPNVKSTNRHEPNVKSTDRYIYVYVQNCMREWNQLDKVIKNSQTIAVSKREFVRLVRTSTWASMTLGEYDY